jgi:hypothetical protein
MIPLNVPNPLKKKSIWEGKVESKVVGWKSYTEHRLVIECPNGAELKRLMITGFFHEDLSLI